MSDKVLHALERYEVVIADSEEIKAGLWSPRDGQDEWGLRLLVLELGQHYDDPGECHDEYHVIALGKWGDSVLGKGIWVKGTTFREVCRAFRDPDEAYKMTADLSKHFSMHGTP